MALIKINNVTAEQLGSDTVTASTSIDTKAFYRNALLQLFVAQNVGKVMTDKELKHEFMLISMRSHPTQKEDSHKMWISHIFSGWKKAGIISVEA